MRVLSCQGVDYVIYGQEVLQVQNNKCSHAISSGEENIFKVAKQKFPFDMKAFGCTKKLFYACHSDDSENFEKASLILPNGTQYGTVTKADGGYKFDLDKPNSFVDVKCDVKKFKLYATKFHFKQGNSFEESITQHFLVHRFCLDTMAVFLESSSEVRKNYILFSQYVGSDKNFFIVQKAPEKISK